MQKTPKVILVDIIDPRTTQKEAQNSLIELENLTNTFGGFVVVKVIQKKQTPNYKTFVGSGKLNEIIGDIGALEADLVIFNNILKPQQIYNISHKIRQEYKGVQVWDRVDLILKIFAKHAESTEAKLQIELASIRHMGPRIFGMGMELSRQGGGIGTRGIGETNTEIMKRHLAEQERKVKDKLKKIQKRHALQRKSRSRQNLKTVAIVGYTNAGKSQLLTALTKKNVKVRDELFATLDTRIGQLYLPESYSTCLLSDTIGFIQNLPPDLIEAFKSTLDETIHADLLLHVIDFSDPRREEKIRVVNEILEKLGVVNTPTIYICNKIDLIKNLRNKTFLKKYKKYNPVFVSALRKEGLRELVGGIEERLKKR